MVTTADPADPLLITGARIVAEREIVENGWVQFDGGRVISRGSGGAPRFDGETVDARGKLLTPGFIDLHVHGGGGGAASDGGDAIDRMLRAHRAHGTTRTVLSLVTAPIDELVDILGSLAPLVRTDPLLLGIHLEGPFLSTHAKGAHDPSALIAPSPAAVAALLDAADGTLAQITIAPELDGAPEAIRTFVEAGVRVAVGHTVADLGTAQAAFDAGASMLTHTFNAMPVLGHRAPGPIGAALEHQGVVLELIADGLHVHPILIAALFRLAPDRIALVTDAMAAAGQADGVYRLGPFDVEVRDGAARLSDGTLAGSTLTLDSAIRTAVAAGVPLAGAVLAATATPAGAIRRPDLGRLDVGSPADAVLLNDTFTVEAVWAAGRRLR